MKAETEERLRVLAASGDVGAEEELLRLEARRSLLHDNTRGWRPKFRKRDGAPIAENTNRFMAWCFLNHHEHTRMIYSNTYRGGDGYELGQEKIVRGLVTE